MSLPFASSGSLPRPVFIASAVWTVRNTRKIGKKDMVRNSGTPNIEVSPETFAVTVDGVHATVPPIKTVSLNQKYFFSCRAP